MTKSLQEQLLALGLAKSEPKSRPKAGPKPYAKATTKPDTKTNRKSNEKSNPGLKSKSAQPEPSLEEAYRIRDRLAKEEEEKARELKRLEDLRRRQVNSEIRAIVDSHRLNDPAAELARNFIYKGRIRKVHVNARQLVELNEGKLGVVYFGGGYHLLESGIVGQVRTLSPEHVPDLAANTAGEEEGEHPVPDDLIW